MVCGVKTELLAEQSALPITRATETLPDPRTPRTRVSRPKAVRSSQPEDRNRIFSEAEVVAGVTFADLSDEITLYSVHPWHVILPPFELVVAELKSVTRYEQSSLARFSRAPRTPEFLIAAVSNSHRHAF